MAQNDNTLGAPTEGLGQRVTFAFAAPGGTPLVAPLGATQIRAGVQGGGTTNLGGTKAELLDRPIVDPTAALLLKIADPIVKKDMKRRQTEAYITGMQRAMQGEAVADIAESQPWYSKLFGDSDVVEGARAYTAETVAQTTIASMEDQMPQLRKMTPSEAQAYYIEAVNSNLTGDVPSDAAILQSLTRALPSVMRRQSKEHYGWQQEQATAAETEAFKAGAVRLQAAGRGLSTGTMTPEEFAPLLDQFTRSVTPALGRNEDNYKQSMTANLVGWANAGQFHALNALKSRGFLDVLEPEQRNTVERAIAAGETQLRSKYSYEWNDELAKIEALAAEPDVGMSTEDLAKRVDALNGTFTAETGSRAGLILPDSRAALLSRSAIAIKRERDRQADKALQDAKAARTAGDKAGAEAAVALTIDQRLSEGTLGTLSANSGYGRTKINERVMPRLSQMPEAERIKVLSLNMREDYVIDPEKNIREGQISAAMREGSFTPAVQQAFDRYVALREYDKAAADAYYDKYKYQLDGFYNDVRNGVAPAGAFQERFLSPPRRAKLDKDEMKSALNVVRDGQNLFMRAWTGEVKLAPGTDRRIINAVSDAAEQFAGSTGNFQEGFERALQAAKRNGLETTGGYVWQNAKGQRSLEQYLTGSAGPTGEAPIPTDKINDEVSLAVDHLLYGEGDVAGTLPDQASDTVMVRLPDKGGVPTFHVQSVVDGKVYDAVFVASDIYKLAAKRREVLSKSKQFGPRITFVPDPAAPSIYAGEEAWAAYRQRKAGQPK